jgi:hypothetical protein
MRSLQNSYSSLRRNNDTIHVPYYSVYFISSTKPYYEYSARVEVILTAKNSEPDWTVTYKAIYVSSQHLLGSMLNPPIFLDRLQCCLQPAT